LLPENPESVLFKDFVSMRLEGIEMLKRIEMNVSSFIRYAEKKKNEITAKLERVKAAPTIDGRGAVILDPTGKLFSVVKIGPLDEESINPITYMIRMEPPYVPHFFLTVAYIYLSKGLIPSAPIRTEPVLSLISLVTKGDKLTSVAAWLMSSAVLIGSFVTGEVSIFPYNPSFLDLPVEADTVYLTNLGYSTEPSKEMGVNVRLELSDLPKIPDELLIKLGFRSYRAVLDEVLDEVV